MSLVTEQKININCQDGYQLVANVYKPATALKGAILIGPATGIKRQFYHNFAQFLAENGYGVLTFDNRGIGESLTGNIRESDASLQCWGEMDMTAAFDKLMSLFPHTCYHLVGHSAGGQLIGLMHNAHHISSVFNVACSSGCLGNMKWPFKFKAHFFMNVVIPVSNTLFGHTKAQWFGMGEPLPKAVAKQWRTWCNGQGYIKTAFGKTVHQHYYNDLEMPALWVNAPDDGIANDANVADMISVFPKMKAQTKTLHKDNYDLKEIGHMKFFSRQSKPLWQYTLDWLAKN